MEPTVQYERHLTSGDEIRLIQLDPGHGGSPLKTTIQYHHLSENPGYQALSYTWGSPFNRDHPSWNPDQVPATQHDLYMDDGVIKVTQSLHSALLRLRQPIRPLVFWVDAICIDQSHDEEKAWQIQKMREIYERAAQVLIWLGPSDATSDIAMSVLQAGYRYTLRAQQYTKLGAKWANVPQPKEGQEFDDQLVAGSFGKMFGMVPQSNVEIPDYPIEAVANLLNRAYWGRGWCWQEFVVATKITIVCGGKILEDGDMCIQTFLETWDSLIEESGRPPHGLDHRPWSMMDLRYSYRNIVYLRDTGFQDDSRIETPDARMPIKVWARDNPRITDVFKAWLFREAVARLSMKELLQESSTSWLETGQKEDQIFALIGMATDAKELGIKIDCAVGWEKVYAQLAVAYIERNDLWFLHLCQGTLPDRSLSLPSWVPDWSQGYHGALISRHYVAPPEHLGTIETGNQPGLQEFESHGRLRLRGIIVDKIAWVSSERFPMSVNQLLTTHRLELYQWIRGVTAQLPSQSHRAIWTAMIANTHRLPLPQEYHEKLTDEEMRAIIDEAFDSILEQDEVENINLQLVIECYLRCFMQATAWKCIFQTRNGRLGLGFTGIQSEDLVAAFMGFETAFVVRSVAVALSESPRYRIVGESYVHELMEDQSLKENAVIEDIILE